MSVASDSETSDRRTPLDDLQLSSAADDDDG